MFLEWTKVALNAAIALAPYQSIIVAVPECERHREKTYVCMGVLSPEEVRRRLAPKPRRKARRKK